MEKKVTSLIEKWLPTINVGIVQISLIIGKNKALHTDVKPSRPHFRQISVPSAFDCHPFCRFGSANVFRCTIKVKLCEAHADSSTSSAWMIQAHSGIVARHAILCNFANHLFSMRISHCVVHYNTDSRCLSTKTSYEAAQRYLCLQQSYSIRQSNCT